MSPCGGALLSGKRARSTAHLALRGQGQALLRNRGSADIPARVPGTRGHTGSVEYRVTGLVGIPAVPRGSSYLSVPGRLCGRVSPGGSESSCVGDVM